MTLSCGFGYLCFFFFQAEDGIRDLVRSRGLGDVYKRQVPRAMRQGRPEDRAHGGVDPREIVGVASQEGEELSLIHI